MFGIILLSKAFPNSERSVCHDEMKSSSWMNPLKSVELRQENTHRLCSENGTHLKLFGIILLSKAFPNSERSACHDEMKSSSWMNPLKLVELTQEKTHRLSSEKGTHLKLLGIILLSKAFPISERSEESPNIRNSSTM
ncbi:MAG: hypothetical protein RLP13_06180 [Cytophagales bacterium]